MGKPWKKPGCVKILRPCVKLTHPHTLSKFQTSPNRVACNQQGGARRSARAAPETEAI
jgi:hypothetical protein